MANYTVVNGNPTQLANVNAGGVDVEAYTYKDGITLTNTELAAAASTAGVAVLPDLTANAAAVQIKGVIAKAMKFASA